MLWVRGHSSPPPCTSRSGAGMLTTHFSVPCLPQGRKVAAKCIEQLAKFKIDRSAHINRDVPLGRSTLTR